MPGREFKTIYGQLPLEIFPVEIEYLKLDLHVSGFLVNKSTINRAFEA